MDNQIHEMMKTSLENIKGMIDGNLILSEPIIIKDTMIIAVSKIKIGFASGGTEQKINSKTAEMKVPFGGGAGGNMSISPQAFLVINNDGVSLLHLDDQTHILEKIIDKIPNFISKVKNQIEDENIIKVTK